MTNDIYDQIESRQRTGYNRTCINGVITGCGKCIGYCQYKGHPGYLTENLRKEHSCIEKKCFYYIPKPKRKKSANEKSSLPNRLLSSAVRMTAQMEGLRIMSVREKSQSHWQINYVTISNEYSIEDLASNLEHDFQIKTTFNRLNYSFDRTAQLILAG